MRYLGTLKKWNAERGFGFIVADDGGQDIFVHATAFARDGNLPTEGERLSFEVEPDRDGKKKAVRVSRASQLAAARNTTPRMARPNYSAPEGTGFGTKLIVLLLLAAIGWYGYSHYAKRTAQIRAEQAMPAATEPPPVSLFVEPPKPVAPTAPAPVRPPPAVVVEPRSSVSASYRCDGRQHCSQMTSCKEAKYFLANCPGVKMDGDHDGVPCEEQWCTSPFAD